MKTKKTIEIVEAWLKKNFKEGELVEIRRSDTAMVITRAKDFMFSYQVKKAKKKKS